MTERKLLTFIIAVALFLCASVCYTHVEKYHFAYQKNIEKIVESSDFQLLFTARSFSRFESQIASTLTLINKSKALDRFARLNTLSNRHQVENIWMALADTQSFFSQIRYVDIDGMEQIKVSYSHLNQAAKSRSDYVDISDAYYFRLGQNLADGAVGNQGIELERLSGDSDEPLSPVLHIITPHEYKGERKGYLVLTIDIWLSSSVLDYSPDPELTPRIVTLGGDYVSHPDPEKLFGFAIPERKVHNIGLSHPHLWFEMQQHSSGSYLRDGNLYIYRLIEIAGGNDLYTLIKFSKAQLDERFYEEYRNILQSAAFTILLILAISLPLLYLINGFRKREIESSLALAALNGMSAVLICDNSYRILKVNGEFEKLTGFMEKQVLHGYIRRLFFNKDEVRTWFDIWDTVKSSYFWEGELKFRRCDGEAFYTITRVQALLDEHNRVTNYIISIVDISERKELEERLRYLSEKDVLSQLWNRRKFEQELKNEVALFERYPENHIGCLAIIDIDNFKRINDEQGHDIGDEVIRRVSGKLAENTRKTDFVARIGGEEFAIIMRHTDIEVAQLVLERIRNAIEVDPDSQTTVSIGYTDIIEDSARCYKNADIALYNAKSLGKNKVSIWHSSDDAA